MSTSSRWRVIAKTGLITIGVFVAPILVDRVAWIRYTRECQRLYADLVHDVEALNVRASRWKSASGVFQDSYCLDQRGGAGHILTTLDFRARGLHVVAILDTDSELPSISVLFRPPPAVWTQYLGVGSFELRGLPGEGVNSTDATLTGYVSIQLDSRGVPKSFQVAPGNLYGAEYTWQRPGPPEVPDPPENRALPKTPSMQE